MFARSNRIGGEIMSILRFFFYAVVIISSFVFSRVSSKSAEKGSVRYKIAFAINVALLIGLGVIEFIIMMP